MLIEGEGSAGVIEEVDGVVTEKGGVPVAGHIGQAAVREGNGSYQDISEVDIAGQYTGVEGNRDCCICGQEEEDTTIDKRTGGVVEFPLATRENPLTLLG